MTLPAGCLLWVSGPGARAGQGNEQAPIAASTAAKPAVEPAAPAAGEARAVVEQFRLAYEARDVDRLAKLFAPDAVDNAQRGIDNIAAAYRRAFAQMDDAAFLVGDLAGTTEGTRSVLSGPFVIAVRTAKGQAELRGTARWAIERRDGTARIVELRYEGKGGSLVGNQSR